MTRQIVLLNFFIWILVATTFSQTKYACFENDKNKKLKISVSFNFKKCNGKSCKERYLDGQSIFVYGVGYGKSYFKRNVV